MIYFLLVFLLSAHVLSAPTDYDIKDKTQSLTEPVLNPEPIESFKADIKHFVEKDALGIPESDLETSPSVWWSYHSYHRHPVIITRPRLYTYYADYIPTYTYWSNW